MMSALERQRLEAIAQFSAAMAEDLQQLRTETSATLVALLKVLTAKGLINLKDLEREKAVAISNIDQIVAEARNEGGL